VIVPRERSAPPKAQKGRFRALLQAKDALLRQKDARIQELEALLQARDTSLQGQDALLEQLRQKDARIQELEALLKARETRIEELESRQGQNSSNSSRPPSSDTPADREKRPQRRPSGRSRGGQRGHKGHRRELISPERVNRIIDLFPTECERCERPLPKRRDQAPIIHQVVELPKLEPDVIQYQCNRGLCRCGHVTCAKLPDGVPKGMCGPRLMALIGLLTGVYHLSRRQATQLLGDVLGVGISLGALSKCEERVSEAIAPAVEEARSYVLEQPLKHVDATGWPLGKRLRSLWTIATPLVTVFCITMSGSKEAVRQMLGKARGILVSDRAPQFGFWAMNRRQICWAHLLRKFISFAEKSGPAGQVGERLLFFTELIFTAWHRVCDGSMSRAQFRRTMTVLRARVEECLERGASLGVRGVSGACKNILVHRNALWAFVDRKGVEPTNNHAEQQLRTFVLWRKKSFGSQSERGCLFVQRIMSVVHTLRKQHRPVFSFLVDACKASLDAGPAPSLLPPKAAEVVRRAKEP
jgi:transposase